MRRALRSSYTFGIALTLLGAVVAVRLAACGSIACAAPSGDGTGGARLAGQSTTFVIAGDTAELISPGVKVPLNVSFTNPHPYRLWVSDLRVTVRGVDAPRADGAHPCTLRDFAVDQLRSSITFELPAGTTRTLRSLRFPREKWPQVGMLDLSVNQDGCKGAFLQLGYSASGKREI